jgi:arylsulfatase A-like enzyme
MPKEKTPIAALAPALLAAAALFGLLARLRVLLVSPLPSDQPLRWLAVGLAGDLAVIGGAGLAASLLGTLSPRLARVFLAAAFLLSGLAVFTFSELLVYFGHPPRRGDFAPASLGRFAAASLDPGAILRFALALLLLGSLALLVSRGAARGRFGTLRPFPLAVATAILLTLALAPLPVHLRRTAVHPLLLALNVRGTALVPDDDGKLAGFRALDPRGGATLPFPPPRPAAVRSPEAPRLPAGLKPNIVFILLEGVRSRELGAWGGGIPGLSPNLDALAKEGRRVDRAYSPGTHTPEGELAFWYGMMATPQALIMTDRPDLPRDGLPEILRAAGWRSFLWIHNGDETFYRRDRFYSPRGFTLIDGRDFSPGDPRTNWGYSDKALMRRSLKALESLAEPFAAMILTVSNHHPFQVPSDAATSFDPPVPARAGFLKIAGLPQLLGLHTGGMLRTIHYTDEAVGDFFAAARERDWYGRTLFVVAGDHGLPIAPLTGSPTPHEFHELRHRVPLLLFSRLLPPGEAVPGPASLYDVAPTLLALSGLPVPPGMPGRDLLDPGGPPDEPVFVWNDDGRVVTAATSRFVWHATVDEGPPLRFAEEALFAAGDGAGTTDLATREPGVLTALREKARAWLSGYFASLEKRASARD